jgi:hypothetical protein
VVCIVRHGGDNSQFRFLGVSLLTIGTVREPAEPGIAWLPGSVLYSSSEPCPMCLTACYWARVSRLVFGVTSYDVAMYGFEDLQLYRELATNTDQRSLPEVSADGPLRALAANVLRDWVDNFPEPVTPKY